MADTEKREAENRRALDARRDPTTRNAFLTEEQKHILHLTARILRCSVSMSDDEYSIALIATNEALDSYEEGKGNFWNYAALVIRSRLLDHFRSQARTSPELLVGPDAFDADPDDSETDTGLKLEVRDRTAVVIDTAIADEIDVLTEELQQYGIDLFELADSAPRSQKTKDMCREILAAIFLPPPLVEELRRSGRLPVKSILERTKFTRKSVDRHRKYLLAATLIKDGDYPRIKEYIV